MSPTSIILCMAACFAGLVAALIVVNRFGSMSTRKLVVIAMMVAVYVVLNTVGTIRLGWINISVSALPIIVGALLYGPGGGLMVGLVGAFLGQLMTYGVTATTVLWIIPPAVRGLLIGLYAKRCGYELSRKQLVGVLIVTSLVVTLLNTGAIYLDSGRSLLRSRLQGYARRYDRAPERFHGSGPDPLHRRFPGHELHGLRCDPLP